MQSNQGLVTFKNPADWELVADINKTATVLGTNSYIPLSSLDLDVTLDAYYIAVLVTVDYRTPKWNFAGQISQVYDFTPLPEGDNYKRLAIAGTDLVIDELKLINTAEVSQDPFSLRFEPPEWFRDYTLKVYGYTGDVFNNVEAVFADIATSITCSGTPQLPILQEQLGSIVDLIQDTERKLSQKITELAEAVESLKCTEPVKPKANGKFTPTQPEENIVNAYYRGFL